MYKVQSNTVIDDNRNIVSNSISHTMATVSPSGGTLTLDLSQASYFKISSLTNINTITITNVPSTYAILFVLEIPYTSSTPVSIVWPEAFHWSDGIAPALSNESGKKDAFVFFSTDTGTTWNAFIAGQNL